MVMAVPATPALAFPIGVDLDISSGDILFTQGGDLALVADEAMVQFHLAARLYDQLGARLFEPTLGAGLSSWVGQPLSPADLASIAQTVLAQAVLVAGVQSVQSATATQGQDQSQIVVQVIATLVGRTAPTTLPIVISGRQAPLYPFTVTAL